MWDWNLIDDYLDFADKNNIILRIHGPISPQASQWAKADNRTKEELNQNMTEYFTALCKRINNEPSVKWMDVVNETITPQSWFEENQELNNGKTGTNQWDSNDVPIYITRHLKLLTNMHPTLV